VFDLHPEAPKAVGATACSRQGFKFAPAAREIADQLALEGETRHPIEFLRLSRFAAGRRTQCETAAAASSDTSVSVWKRSSSNGAISSGVLPVATSSASVQPTTGAALKP
jgi:hypothetical protein